VRVKKLTDRLAAIAGLVSLGETVADIGADHGYLPLHLVREGISPSAILTDKAPGPLEKARNNVERANALYPGPEGSSITLRLGDGLSALKDSEVDVVVIAGMGGDTILSILGADPLKAVSFRKYILQPRTKPGILRAWLAETGWTVISEATAEERGRVCEIIVCVPGEDSRAFRS